MKPPTYYGENILPPLSEYVVIEHLPKPKERPKVQWDDWEFRKSRPYTIKSYGRTVNIDGPEPTDVEIVLDEFNTNMGWKIVWD